MLYDVRTYELKPGGLKPYMETYKEFGMAAQIQALGKPVFYAVTESGPLNTFTHIWAFKDAADREAKRAAMWANPDWLAYIRKVGEMNLLVRQENRLMSPTDFFAQMAEDAS